MNQEISPAEAALLAMGLPFRRMEYEYHERGGTADAACQLGVDEYGIVKSLVFDDALQSPQRGVMALMHGNRRVSVRKLERLCGLPRLAPAAPQSALALSGYEPGGICPFALAAPLPVFVQQSLLDLEKIIINAGRRGIVVEIAPTALLRLGIHTGEFAATLDAEHKNG